MANNQNIEGIIEARQLLTQMLTEAAAAAQQAGKIPQVTLPEVSVERPQNTDHGDYASSFPLKLARSARANPMSLANDLVKFLPDKGIADVTVAPPGFINFTLKTQWLTGQVNSILAQGDKVLVGNHPALRQTLPPDYYATWRRPFQLTTVCRSQRGLIHAAMPFTTDSSTCPGC